MKRLTKKTWLVVVGMLVVAVAVVWIWDANRVKPLGTKRVDLGNGVTMDFVWIPPGEFMMGSPTNEVGRGDDETLHQVKISKGFWMGKYEVTQKQYLAVMGTNPSQFKLGGSYPVDTVSWEDAVTFWREGEGAGGSGVAVADRGGMGVCLPGRDNDGVLHG